MSELATKADCNSIIGSSLSPTNEYVTYSEVINASGKVNGSYSSNELVQVTDIYKNSQTSYSWYVTIPTGNGNSIPNVSSEVYLEGSAAGSNTTTATYYTTTYLSSSNYRIGNNTNTIVYKYGSSWYKLTMGSGSSSLNLTIKSRTQDNRQGDSFTYASFKANLFVNNCNITASNGVHDEWLGIENALDISSGDYNDNCLYLFWTSSGTRSFSPTQYIGSTSDLEDIEGWGVYPGKTAFLDWNIPIINSSGDKVIQKLDLNSYTLWGFYLYREDNTDPYKWVEAFSYTQEGDMNPNYYYGDLGRVFESINSYIPSDSVPANKCRTTLATYG